VRADGFAVGLSQTNLPKCGVSLNAVWSNFLARQETMSEISKLEALRQKLVNRRRALTASLEDTPEGNITGRTFAEVQGAIDAVDRAIADERQVQKS
jgi:hypothetical protein